MDLSFYHYAIAIFGGALAGAINTMAGNGSAITLTILIDIMGLPANIANGTNRIGIVAQTIASTFAFYKKGRLEVAKNQHIILLTIIGAIAGVVVATRISNEVFIAVFRYLMILMLLVILVKPARWLQETDRERKLPWVISIPLFLAIGFYGGFIQMGMGIFFLAIMVLGAKYSLMDSNIVKSLIIAIYTAIVLAFFHYKGLVDWRVGGIMAIGQTTGGYFMALIASKNPRANIWAYRLLVIVVILAVLRLFKII